MPTARHGEERAWLVFRLGPHLLCASALDVEGIIEPVRARPVPFTPPYVLGWFDFRGRVASVVSLRRKFGVRSGEDCAAGPYVVARVQADLVAFWVDEVRDVLEAQQASWQPMPQMPGASIFDRYTIRDGDVILHTTFEGLLRADAVAGFPAPAQGPAQAAPAPAQPSSGQEAGPDPSYAPAPAQAPSAAETAKPTAPAPEPPRAPTRPREEPPAPRPPVRPEPTRKPERRPVEAPPVPLEQRAPATGRIAPSMPISYEPRDFEVDAAEPPPAREHRPARGRLRAAVILGFALLIAAGIYAWRTGAPVPPPAPSAQTGAIAQPEASAPPEPPPTARIATIKTEAFTMAVDRPAKPASAVPAAAPAASPNPDRAERRITHVVVRGDTLSHIAHRYLGDAARYPELAQRSRIRDPDLIHPGDIVTIVDSRPRR